MPLPTSSQPFARAMALAALAFSLGAATLLGVLNDRAGQEPVADRYVATGPAQDHRQRDPFRTNGCISLDAAPPAGRSAQACDRAADAVAAAWPPQADFLRSTLVQYTVPRRGHSPNMQALQTAPGLEIPIAQGRNVVLGLQPAVQAQAQATVACYTGEAAACGTCRWCSTAGAELMYEQARAAAAGILVLDARTGEIEAAASAYTPCYAQRQRGEAPSPGCPDLPNTRLPRPDRLGNLALERAAPPGSLVKPLIALALVQAGLSPAETAALPAIITYSKTEDLIDITMCKARGFDVGCARTRLAAVAQAARDLGWQGNMDVLGAGQWPELQAPRFTGRLLALPDGRRMTDGPPGFTQATLQACSQQHWRGCSGAQLVNLVAELFGTGEALASPLGIGNGLLQLAAAANGAGHLAPVHLVHAAQQDDGTMAAVRPSLSAAVNTTQAAPVLQGMLQTSTQGTAASACRAAAAVPTGALLPCAPQPRGHELPAIRIAGKTGTPVFSAEHGTSVSLPLPQWRAQCQAIRQELAGTPRTSHRWSALANEAGKCNMVPTKWFAFLVGAPGGTTWDKVVVVQAERNWNQRSHQRIDTPNDIGSNVAAEMGLALAGALYPAGQQVQP